MIVRATINTPGKRGNRPHIGSATKHNYGVKSHGSLIEVDTRDVARNPAIYLNPRTGQPYMANPEGTAILVEQDDIVSNEKVIGAAERGDVNAEHERTMQTYRQRTAQRTQLLDHTHTLALQAKGQIRQVTAADEPDAIRKIQDSLTPPADPLAGLTSVTGIGEATALKLVGAGITDPVELVGLTKDQLIEVGVPTMSADKVIAWLESNVEVVQDE